MQFYILNKSLVIQGIIDVYTSAIWTERYYTSGDFELYVPATPEALALLQKEYFVARVDDTTKCGIIEKVTVETDAEAGAYITASGRNLSSLLSRRIIWRQATFNGYVEAGIRAMVEDALINPEDAARAINNLSLGSKIGLSDTFQSQQAGENLAETITLICQKYGIGYKIALDLPNSGFIFSLYKGEDRSYNQNTNPFVVFSPDFDNLISSEYSQDITGYKNTAQVAGEGQGIGRTKVTINGTNSGLDRYEGYVDAQSTSENSGEVGTSDYEAMLEQQGYEFLAGVGITEAMASEIASDVNFKLNTDYFLGDIVQVINEYGITMTPRVTEIIECQDTTGYSCIPTFSIE